MFRYEAVDIPVSVLGRELVGSGGLDSVDPTCSSQNSASYRSLSLELTRDGELSLTLQESGVSADELLGLETQLLVHVLHNTDNTVLQLSVSHSLLSSISWAPFSVYRKLNVVVSKTSMNIFHIPKPCPTTQASYPQLCSVLLLRNPRYRREVRETDNQTIHHEFFPRAKPQTPHHQTPNKNTERVCPYIDVPDCDTTHICKLFFILR